MHRNCDVKGRMRIKGVKCSKVFSLCEEDKGTNQLYFNKSRIMLSARKVCDFQIRRGKNYSKEINA